MSKHRTTDLDLARDELFSHIHRCGVLKATVEQQDEWMTDTLDYLAERFPALSSADLAELKNIGMRFCAPPIPHGKEHTALSDSESEQTEATAQTEASEQAEDAEQNEMAGAA